MEDFFSILNKNYGVSRGTFQKFELYKDLLVKWQQAINLVSRGTLDDFYTRHLLDSLQLSKYINQVIATDSNLQDCRKKTPLRIKILDVGSGGGFPGMVLAMYDSKYDVTCLDSNHRKMIFLDSVAHHTTTKVNIVTKRIENFDRNDFDVLCARGFASLSTLIPLAKKHTKNGIGVFLKGRKVATEIEEAEQNFKFRYNIYNSETDKFGRIIVTIAS